MDGGRRERWREGREERGDGWRGGRREGWMEKRDGMEVEGEEGGGLEREKRRGGGRRGGMYVE